MERNWRMIRGFLVGAALAATPIRADEAGQKEMLRLTLEAIELPSNEIEQKIEKYSMAIKHYSRFYLPWTNRAVCYLNWGHWDRAIEDATTAIQLAPKEPHSWGVRGRAYASKKDYEKAFADLGQALELAKTPDQMRNLHNDRGNAYFSKREYDAAIKDYEEAVGIDPTFTEGWNNLGIAFRAKGDLSRAFHYFDRAHRQDDKYARVIVNRGRVYVALNDQVHALEDFNLAIELDPGDFSAYLHRGMFHFLQNDAESARKDFDESISRLPKSSYAAIWRYLANQRLKAKAEGEAQLKAFFELRALDDLWPLPVAQFFLGNAKELDVIKAAAQTEDEEQHRERLAEGYYFLAQYYMSEGNEAKFKEFLQKSVEQNVPRVQESVMAKITLEGWSTPKPPDPIPLPSISRIRLR